MVFLTILFFTLTLYGLFCTPPFSKAARQAQILSIRISEGEDGQKLGQEFAKEGCLPLIFGAILTAVEIWYLISALSYDPYIYPTIIALVVVIAVFIYRTKKKKPEAMTPEERMLKKLELSQPHKKTLWYIIRSLAWLTYFGYMFYSLVIQ